MPGRSRVRQRIRRRSTARLEDLRTGGGSAGSHFPANTGKCNGEHGWGRCCGCPRTRPFTRFLAVLRGSLEVCGWCRLPHWYERRPPPASALRRSLRSTRAFRSGRSLTGGQSVRAAEVSGCRSSHSRRTTSATAMRMSRRSSRGGPWPRRMRRATDGAAEARARRTRQGDLHRRAERHSSRPSPSWRRRG